MTKLKGYITHKLQKAFIEDWDPIGVGSIHEAQNEYDPYLEDTYELILNGATEEEVFEHLHLLETQCMGLEGDNENTKKFARKLLTLVKQLFP
jgi:hypothetical protein